jgi:hypothetical protein
VSPSVGELKGKTMLDEPVTRVVKHGVFWYHAPEVGIVNGEEKVLLVEKLAFHGQAVEINRQADLDRGELHGAFFTEEEGERILARQSGADIPEPVGGRDGEDEPREVSELDEDELVDWLMGTGEFDGRKKPNADEVVAAAGDDPELAGRLLDAEERAQGGQPRQGVEQGLNKVIEES